MIQSRKELREWLSYEKGKYSEINRRGVWRYIACTEVAVIWNFQKRLRITEYHYNSGHRIRYILNTVILNKKRNKYGLHIAINVFDKGMKIMHLGPILTNPHVKVGKDCSVHIGTAFVAQGVTDGTPTIGDNVVIGVGATLLGDIQIANGIAVGANALVNKSFIEEEIAIAGVPARKISDHGRKMWNKTMADK